MRLQNPHWKAMSVKQPRFMGGEMEMSSYQPAGHIPREMYTQPVFPPQQHVPELRQPTIYSDGKTPISNLQILRSSSTLVYLTILVSLYFQC